ncbi:hypothetical protein Cfor_00813 [Coptotermes formosanus]|uniref:Uncharacterized protein n=1 Tax=Coptotermes formosanus TaxID=36987 RepID=A0A6L2PUJ6_COPFO|nr:hypothetical protein Cfor_00813 [Coptotermes formosanus]
MLFSCTTDSSSSFVLNIFSLALIFIFIPDALVAYPVFGTKSYGRSTGLPHRVSTWGFPAPPPLQPYQHSQTHYGLGISSAPNYYAADSVVSYPYTQDYPDNDYYYYAQEPSTFGNYPYYPTGTSVTNGNMKYSAYQPLSPYYYADGRQRMGYGYYGYDETRDPVYDLQEEIQQEEEREQREETLPIGQETWFEGGSDSQRQTQGDNMADINAAFLQNLIMSQMYNDANSGHVQRHPPYSSYSVTEDGNQDSWVYDTSRTDNYENNEEELEDEDVRELKSLVKKNRSGEFEDHSGNGQNKWHSTIPSKQNDQDQTWYTHSSEMVNAYRPDYYEPIWFPTENGPWFENNWGTSMSYKRSNEPLYQSIRSYNKKQESSKYGPWIPKGNINFSDRKGNGITASASGPKIAKIHHEEHNADRARKVKTTPTDKFPVHFTTSTPIPTTSAVTSSPDKGTSTSPTESESRRGQKEVALLRPPAPARIPLTEQPVDKMLTHSRPNAHHGSSVYDTIKHLLGMMKGLPKVRTSLPLQLNI